MRKSSLFYSFAIYLILQKHLLTLIHICLRIESSLSYEGRKSMSNYNILIPMIPVVCAVIDSSYTMDGTPDPVEIHIPLREVTNVIHAFNDAFDAIEDAKLNNVDWAHLGSSGSFDVFGQKTISGDIMFEFGFSMEMIEDWEYSWRMKYDDAVSFVKYLEKISV